MNNQQKAFQRISTQLINFTLNDWDDLELKISTYGENHEIIWTNDDGNGTIIIYPDGSASGNFPYGFFI